MKNHGPKDNSRIVSKCKVIVSKRTILIKKGTEKLTNTKDSENSGSFIKQSDLNISECESNNEIISRRRCKKIKIVHVEDGETRNGSSQNMDTSQTPEVNESSEMQDNPHTLTGGGLSQFIQVESKRRKSSGEEKEQNAQNKRQKPNDTFVIATSNKYNALATKEAVNTAVGDEASNDANQTEKTTKVAKKAVKPPPIIIHGKVTNHKEFVAATKAQLNGDFFLDQGKNRTNIFVNDMSDHKKLVEILKTEGPDYVQFHTYTTKEQKTHSFVIRGLPSDVTAQEVQENLKQIYEINAIKVSKMTTKRNPLYMVVTQQDVKLENLQNHVKYLFHARLTWERYLLKKKMTQCHLCQEWGHATANCHSKPKCMKCAEEHITSKCPRKEKDPLKCANCEGEHLANSTECEAYKSRTKWLDEKSNKNKNKNRMHKEPERPNIGSRKEFPEPRWAREPAPNNSYWERRKEPMRTNEAESTGAMGSMKELISEINKLDSMLNIQHMLEQIKVLNAKLARCTERSQKFEVFCKFVNALDNDK